ncbi:MAG: hypothetical protein WAM11_16545 [Cyanobium sp.]
MASVLLLSNGPVPPSSVAIAGRGRQPPQPWLGGRSHYAEEPLIERRR